jgi:hypothetical protein
MVKSLFVKGAYLYSLDKELSEDEFIKKAGGVEKFMKFRDCPFVSLVLDIPEHPFLVGHAHRRTINLSVAGMGHKLYQTMEWSKGEK